MYGLNNDRNIAILAAICAFLVLTMTPLLRESNEYPLGTEAHELLRDAKLYQQGIRYDVLDNTLVEFKLATQLSAGLLFVFNDTQISQYLPLIIGMLCAAYTYLLLRKYKKGIKTSALASILMILHPAFLTTHSMLNYALLTLFFTVLTLYYSDNRIMKYFLGLLLALTSPLAFIAVMILLFKMRNGSKSLSITGILLGAFVWFTMPFNPFTLQAKLFSEFGYALALNLPMTILFLIGLMQDWRKRDSMTNLLIILVLLSAFILPDMMIASAPLIGLLSAQALLRLQESRWELSNLKQVALLLVACTLIFSATSHINTLSEQQPTSEYVRAIKNLEGITLTHPANEEFINYYVSRPTVYDAELLQTRDADFASERMRGIDSIFITHDMREGDVWVRENQGLLFLLENSNHYQMAYKYKKNDQWYEIWRSAVQS